MKQIYQIGDSHTCLFRTLPEHSANYYRKSLPDVFGTPFLVMAAEEATAALMDLWLEPGESSVGAQVNIRHTSPTPTGMEVRTVATLAETNGRKFVFDVACFDEVETIGYAQVTRFVVNAQELERFVAEKNRK
jgi:predicted thioesterase